MTNDLLALADWLRGEGCGPVVMESTGSYWRPVFNLLEEQCEVIVVNAYHVTAVLGRTTDVKDAEWLADLLRHGLLRASFIPAPAQRHLRDLTRYRIQPQMVHAGELRTNGLGQQPLDPITVHAGGRVHVERTDQAFGVHQHVARAPDQLLGAVVAAHAAHLGGLDGLAVDRARTGLRIASQADAQALAQEPMHPFPGAVEPPGAQIVVHRLPGWPLLRQQALGTAGAHDIQDGVYTGAQGMVARPTGTFCLRREEGLHHVPLGVGEVGQIGVRVHTPQPIQRRCLLAFSPFSDGLSYQLRLDTCSLTESRVSRTRRGVPRCLPSTLTVLVTLGS